MSITKVKNENRNIEKKICNSCEQEKDINLDYYPSNKSVCKICCMVNNKLYRAKKRSETKTMTVKLPKDIQRLEGDIEELKEKLRLLMKLLKSSKLMRKELKIREQDSDEE